MRTLSYLIERTACLLVLGMDASQAQLPRPVAPAKVAKSSQSAVAPAYQNVIRIVQRSLSSGDFRTLVAMMHFHQREISRQQAALPRAMWSQAAEQYLASKANQLSRSATGWTSYFEGVSGLTGDPAVSIREMNRLLPPSATFVATEQRFADRHAFDDGPSRVVTVYVQVTYSKPRVAPVVNGWKIMQRAILQFDFAPGQPLIVGMGMVRDSAVFRQPPFPKEDWDYLHELLLRVYDNEHSKQARGNLEAEIANSGRDFAIAFFKRVLAPHPSSYDRRAGAITALARLGYERINEFAEELIPLGSRDPKDSNGAECYGLASSPMIEAVDAVQSGANMAADRREALRSKLVRALERQTLAGCRDDRFLRALGRLEDKSWGTLEQYVLPSDAWMGVGYRTIYSELFKGIMGPDSAAFVDIESSANADLRRIRDLLLPCERRSPLDYHQGCESEFLVRSIHIEGDGMIRCEVLVAKTARTRIEEPSNKPLFAAEATIAWSPSPKAWRINAFRVTESHIQDSFAEELPVISTGEKNLKPPSVVAKADSSRVEESAKKAGISGRVVLAFRVDLEGRARLIRVRQSLHPVVDWEAINCLKQWRFAPGRLLDSPVIVAAQVEFSIKK